MVTDGITTQETVQVGLTEVFFSLSIKISKNDIVGIVLWTIIMCIRSNFNNFFVKLRYWFINR